ncbi:MAG: phytoene desaturase [Spirochaetales bacterium]|nr:phytoene desaturase [Spirochaetales bacterium]
MIPPGNRPGNRGFQGRAMEKRVVIIGAGLAGLTAAIKLARKGFKVSVYEKHGTPGGVARTIEDRGFRFDTGPTWYLMPEVFESYFSSVDRKIEDYLDIVPLSPSYKIFFEKDEPVVIHREMEKNITLFDSLEKDGGKKLQGYLKDSKFKYEAALKEFLYRDYRGPFDFLHWPLIRDGLRLNLLRTLDNHVSRTFSDHRSKKIVEFNTVFLGSSPYKTPALYSLMAHVDLTIGVYYPMGGIHELAKALYRIGREYGVEYHFNNEVKHIIARGGKAEGIETAAETVKADIVLSAAEYHHTDTALLDRKHRNYPDLYWKTRIMAPATLLLYVGVKKKLPKLLHHTFYLADDWSVHFNEIFNTKRWSGNPCYYLGCPSKTDPSVAPEGMENLFILVPLAPGMDDHDSVREEYADRILRHLETLIGEEFASDIAVKYIASQRDFITNNHYYRGTALGLAHTLSQTAIFRPSHRSFRLKNLYYTGHYTQPGIGMPMAMIGSELVCDLITRRHA